MFRKNLESDQIILKTKQDCILIYNETVLEKNILLILHIVITSLSADVNYAMTYIPKFDIEPSLSKKTFHCFIYLHLVWVYSNICMRKSIFSRKLLLS